MRELVAHAVDGSGVQWRTAIPGAAHRYSIRAVGAGAGGRRPYFALEFVRGPSLTEYARLHRLGTAARLELMLSDPAPRITPIVTAHMKT